jgi:hypothetical protein
VTLAKLITNPLSIFRGPAKKGPKALPYKLDFTATQLFTLDFTGLELQEFLEGVQTIFVDNSLNTATLIITCSNTGQIVTYPAKSCGYATLLQPIPGTIDIFTTGGVVINLQLLNFHIDPMIWSVSPVAAPTTGGMKLLGAILYDPAVKVNKSAAALLAMTAIDTVNLRLTVTVPASGIIMVRLACGGLNSTIPAILLGVMNGAAIVARAPVISRMEQGCFVQMVIPGLTPSTPITLDAAYSVKIVAAGANLSYGGPNDAVASSADGAFSFEIWDTGA